MKRGRKCAGFTLVEIIVVLAIVSLLSAILFAVFSRVRQSSSRSVCQSNLKKIALAIQQYTSDADGYYPIGSYKVDNSIARDGYFQWDDAISPYLKNTEIFFCPTTFRKDIIYSTGYDYNSRRLNLFTRGFLDTNRRGRHEATQKFVTLTPLNTEALVDANGQPLFEKTPQLSSCGRPYYGNMLHFGGSNVSFVDGHVKWFTPQQLGEFECANDPDPSLFEN